MSISDLGAFGSFIASIAVFVTLVYLARQVSQGNTLHRMQSRETMMNQDLITLQLQLSDLGITQAFYKDNPDEDELLKLQLFLTLFLRQREWEWLMHKDGIFPEDVYQTYLGVIALFFGTERTRNWWKEIGKTAMDAEFAAEVDRLIDGQPLTEYWAKSAQFARNGWRPA